MKKNFFLVFIVMSVLMLAISGCGGSDGGSDGVDVNATSENNAPIANAGADQNIVTASIVTLDGSSSSDADSDSLTYAWSILSKPAGSTAALLGETFVNSMFVADLDGVYVVQLIVNDGTTSSTSDVVTVNASTLNSAPVADAGIDQNINTTSVATLDGSSSSDANSDSLTYAWSIVSKPAGSIADLSDATAVNPTFEADLDGTYVVELVVNDGTVDSASDSVTINASTLNSAPVANAGADQNVNTASTVTLDGSSSSDANSDSLAYTWSIVSKPAGSVATLSDVAVVAPTFEADLDGAYVVQLIVNDGTVDSASDTTTVNASTPIITHNGYTYQNVVSPYTGRIWLDRNLGATRVCEAFDDAQCYGDYYQWGRATDGHEKVGSLTTSTQAADITPNHNKFIVNSFGWTTGDDDGSLRSASWNKTDGTSVCPVGYRVPTITELENETINSTDGMSNSVDAFNNFLKLPSAGYRDNSTSTGVNNKGLDGYIWSSDVYSASNSKRLHFDATTATIGYGGSSFGESVRCIKHFWFFIPVFPLYPFL